MAAFLTSTLLKKKKKEKIFEILLQVSNDYDRLKSMDWSIDSFIDLLIGLTYRWVLTICLSITLFVYSQWAVPCPSVWGKGGGLRAGSGERPCLEAAGGSEWRETDWRKGWWGGFVGTQCQERGELGNAMAVQLRAPLESYSLLLLTRQH